MTDSVIIPLFKKADLDASIGVFFDGFSKVIVAVAILLGTFGLDGATVFGRPRPHRHPRGPAGRPDVHLAVLHHAAGVQHHRRRPAGL